MGSGWKLDVQAGRPPANPRKARVLGSSLFLLVLALKWESQNSKCKPGLSGHHLAVRVTVADRIHRVYLFAGLIYDFVVFIQMV